MGFFWDFMGFNGDFQWDLMVILMGFNGDFNGDLHWGCIPS